MASKRLREFVEAMLGEALAHSKLTDTPQGLVVTCDYTGPGGIEPQNFPPWLDVRSAVVVFELSDNGRED